jgi:hypothetical protein
MVASASSTLARRLPLAFDPFGKLLSARFSVPLLECLVRDFALDEEFGKFAALCLAFERHWCRHLLSRLFTTDVNVGDPP